MPLSQEVTQRVLDHINAKSHTKGCALCGGREFDLSSEVLGIPTLTGEDDKASLDLTRAFPVVRVTCMNCASVTLLAAGRLGLVTV